MAFFQACDRNSRDTFGCDSDESGPGTARPGASQFWSRMPTGLTWGPETPGIPVAAQLSLLRQSPLGVSRNAGRNIGFKHCQRFQEVGFSLVWADPA